MSSNSIYFVYALFDHEIFYIGFSKNRSRPIDHFKVNRFIQGNHKNNRIFKNYSKENFQSYMIIKNDMSKEEAMSLEKDLISIFGRRCLGTGKLVNIQSGGEGGSYKPSAEQILKQKETRKRNGTELKLSSGLAPAKDAKTGEKLGRVSVNDPRWDSGEIVGMMHGIPSKRKKEKKEKEKKPRVVWNKGLTKHTDSRIVKSNTPLMCCCVICQKEVQVPNLSRHHKH